MNAHKAMVRTHLIALATVTPGVGGAIWTYIGESGVPILDDDAASFAVEDEPRREDNGDHDVDAGVEGCGVVVVWDSEATRGDA